MFDAVTLMISVLGGSTAGGSTVPSNSNSIREMWLFDNVPRPFLVGLIPILHWERRAKRLAQCLQGEFALLQIGILHPEAGEQFDMDGSTSTSGGSAALILTHNSRLFGLMSLLPNTQILQGLMHGRSKHINACGLNYDD